MSQNIDAHRAGLAWSAAVAVLLGACTEKLPVEPPSFLSMQGTYTVSGHVVGPNGSSFCDYVLSDAVTILRLFPESGQSPIRDVSLVDNCRRDPTDNRYSMTVDDPSGVYYLYLTFIENQGPFSALPVRNLDVAPVDFSEGDVERDIHLVPGAPLGGSVSLDGEPIGGLSSNVYFAALGQFHRFPILLVTAPDGTWIDGFNHRSPAFLQAGVLYVGSDICPALRPDTRLVSDTLPPHFIFPTDLPMHELNCHYETFVPARNVEGIHGVTANSYVLHLGAKTFPHSGPAPALGQAVFNDGTAVADVLSGGGLAYTTDNEHVLTSYDPRGLTRSHLVSILELPCVQALWPDPPDVTSVCASDVDDGGAVHHTVALFSEQPEQDELPTTGLGLITVRETIAYSAPPDDDYVIVKYTLLNPGPVPVSGLTLGQVLDHDLGIRVAENVVEYDAESEVAVIYDPRPWPFASPVVAGHALLGSSPANYRSWRNSAEPPGDPATTAQLHEYLTGGIVDPGPLGPHDIRHLLSTDPVTIASGASVAFAAVLAAGHDRADLLHNVARARAQYAALGQEGRDPFDDWIPVEMTVGTIKPFAGGDVSVKLHFLSDLDFLSDPDLDVFGPSWINGWIKCSPVRQAALRDITLDWAPPTEASHNKNRITLKFPASHFQGVADGGDVLCVGRLATPGFSGFYLGRAAVNAESKPTLDPPAPTVAWVSPTYGFPGTPVTVSGSDLWRAGVSWELTLGGMPVPLSLVAEANSSTISFRAPDLGAPGPRELFVTVDGVQSNSVWWDQTPSPVPTITSITPTHGPIGTIVTIAGSDLFVPGWTQVSLGGSQISPLFMQAVSPNSITFFAWNTGTIGPAEVLVKVGERQTSGAWTLDAIDDPTEPHNDNLDSAPTVTLPLDMVGSFRGGDVDDVYAVTLDQPETLQFSLDWNYPPQDLDVVVLDADGNPGACGYQGTSLQKPEMFSCFLPAGEYGLMVQDWTRVTGGTAALVSYRLSVQ